MPERHTQSGAAGAGGDEEIRRKAFFFEKKNQKTFTHKAPRLRRVVCQVTKSFLLLFFKKEVLSFSLLRHQQPYQPIQLIERPVMDAHSAAASVERDLNSQP
jgi:hypothetical protein